MKKLSRLAALLALIAFSAPAIALAQDGGASDMSSSVAADAGVSAPTSAATPDPGSDPTGYVKAIYEAASDKDYRILVALFLIGFVFVGRRFASQIPGKAGAFFASDRGGALLTIGMSLAGGAVTALMGGGALSAAMVGNAMINAVIAAGGYSLIKKADLLSLVGKKGGAAALIAFFAFSATGCAAYYKWAAAHPKISGALNCAVSEIESALPTVLADVFAAISGASPDWAALGNLEKSHSPALVACAVQKLVADASTGTGQAGAMPSWLRDNIKKNGGEFLAVKGVQ